METNNKRRALGRGLEELFFNEPIAYDKVEEKIDNFHWKDINMLCGRLIREIKRHTEREP